MREPAVYIMASRRNGTLYTGVTANLSRRASEHREGLVPGFTSRYDCKLLEHDPEKLQTFRTRSCGTIKS